MLRPWSALLPAVPVGVAHRLAGIGTGPEADRRAAPSVGPGRDRRAAFVPLGETQADGAAAGLAVALGQGGFVRLGLARPVGSDGVAQAPADADGGEAA